jgi:hypothetical protein
MQYLGADEIYLKIKGNIKCLFLMMNDETCFGLAQEMAEIMVEGENKWRTIIENANRSKR